MNRPSRIALAAAALLAAHVHAQSAPNAQENRPPARPRPQRRSRP